jgi:hypothetical protein
MAIKKKKVRPPTRPPVGKLKWLSDRFDKLERDHKVIVKLLEGGNVSEKLSEQIRLARGKGITIDRKVTDLKTEE